MNYEIIATGSQGNAVVLNGSILIDCGVPFRALAKVKKDLQIVLCTHEHTDHLKKSTVRKLAGSRPTLRWACCEWLVPHLIKAGVSERNIDCLRIAHVYDYGAFKVSPVKLYHDVENCGWRVFIGPEKAIYMTDTVTLEGITAENYDLYLVEANYSEAEIQERIAIKEATGQYIYEYRVLKTHLSKEKCDEWLLNNLGERSEYVYIHQHKENENEKAIEGDSIPEN